MNSAVKNYEENQIPIGVKVIAVLYYIISVLGIVLALFIFVMAGILIFNPESILYSDEMDKVGFMIIGLLIGGVIYLGLGILGFFIGKDLWRLKHWARVTAVIISGFEVIVSIMPLILIAMISLSEKDIKGIIGVGILLVFILINLFIVLYLLLNKNVKTIFGKNINLHSLSKQLNWKIK